MIKWNDPCQNKSLLLRIDGIAVHVTNVYHLNKTHIFFPCSNKIQRNFYWVLCFLRSIIFFFFASNTLIHFQWLYFDIVYCTCILPDLCGNLCVCISVLSHSHCFQFASVTLALCTRSSHKSNISFRIFIDMCASVILKRRCCSEYWNESNVAKIKN